VLEKLIEVFLTIEANQCTRELLHQSDPEITVSCLFPDLRIPTTLVSSGKFREGTMNKDEVKGKAKDIAGRIQRQAGEWVGDDTSQAKGAAKQVEGKVQNAWGKVKDAAKSDEDDTK
jgi:uncharacterized protein YjbJ (UPF0337 family)